MTRKARAPTPVPARVCSAALENHFRSRVSLQAERTFWAPRFRPTPSTCSRSHSSQVQPPLAYTALFRMICGSYKSTNQSVCGFGATDDTFFFFFVVFVCGAWGVERNAAVRRLVVRAGRRDKYQVDDQEQVDMWIATLRRKVCCSCFCPLPAPISP